MRKQTIILPQMMEIMKADYQVMRQCDFLKKYKIWIVTTLKLFWHKKSQNPYKPEVYKKPVKEEIKPKDYSIFKKVKEKKYYLEKWAEIVQSKSIFDVMWVKSIGNIY
jgi:hypothetical protein